MRKLIYLTLLIVIIIACSNDDEPTKSSVSLTFTRVEHGLYEECTNLIPPNDAYVYPAYPGTAEWNEFHAKYGGIDTIIRALLPTDVVAANMSTESLIYAYVDFPFGHGFQNFQETIEKEFEEFSICRELKNRSDAASILMKKYGTFNVAGCEQGLVAHYPLLSLISADCIHNQLNKFETEELVRLIMRKWTDCQSVNNIKNTKSILGNKLFVAFTVGRLMKDVEFAPMLDLLKEDSLITSFIYEWRNPTELEYGSVDKILAVANLYIK